MAFADLIQQYQTRTPAYQLRSQVPPGVVPAGQQEAPGFQLPLATMSQMDTQQAPAPFAPTPAGQNLYNSYTPAQQKAVTGGVPAGTFPGVPAGAGGKYATKEDALRAALAQGLKGTAATDFVKAQGFQDNGLYYPDSGLYGFSDSYMGSEGHVTQRSPEGGGGQFTDPLTAQYEKLLQAQLATYQQQQAQWQAEAQRQEGTRAQTAEAVKRLTDFANQRVSKLQAPAYTGSEQEILRTQALDPIEHDRTAAQQNALQNIGSRGMDPTSGVAQQLLQNVNQGYDQQRAGAQNTLASAQIQEQRSRDQEAQQLLQYLAQLPEAAASGDMNFVNMLNQMINQASNAGTATGGMLADLPVQRTQLAAQIAGLGGQPQNSVNSLLALLQNAQNQRQTSQNQTASFWNAIGTAF